MNIELKKNAIRLRKNGLSYSEILKEITVAKSTLSLWLRSVGLSKQQKQRLTEKKLAAMKKGWLRVREKRLQSVAAIQKSAHVEALQFMKDPLWIAGTILYWAEGTKNKPWSISGRIIFTNMDPMAIKLFRAWILKYGNITTTDLIYEIYIHPTSDINRARHYWGSILKISSAAFRVYYKKANDSPARKNINESYYGVMRIVVRKSTNLLRRVEEWIQSVVNYIG